MKYKEYDFPDDLYYTDRHLWVKKESDGSIAIGFNDLAQKLIGKVMFLRLPKKGAVLEAGKEFGTVESVKWVERLKAPISGVVKDVNASLRVNPKLVNQEPYNAWFIKVEPTEKLEEELSQLIHGEKLADWVKKEIEEKTKK
ncbi:glycine cleavage system protein H [Candidatus Bathyarchaeota archaeon]|nr:glycine cleavage system protein H [Candidatus Bathyarchaeota archaeon]